MGTIAEKLTYLNETKNAIKNAIVNKGVSVNDSDTFRSYADKISSIEAGGGTGGDAELEASFISSIDDSLGANVTKLPSGLTSIGARAFYQKSNLALTELPSGVTSIGTNAFYYCTKLALTELPNGITSIGAEAFRGCTKLAITKLPDEVTTLGNSSFEACSSIQTMEVPSGVTTIPNRLFNSCSKMTYLHFKGNITSTGTYCFQTCTKLTTFVLSGVTKAFALGSMSLSNTPMASGTGFIYVPDNLVESFKTASGWSTYANQIKGLSELESQEV